MQHFSIPAHELTEDVFEDGLGFDGSSIRGFQEIQESDMLLIPDPDTAVIDPFTQHKTLNINCFVHDPVTGEAYSRDPRYIAKKAEDYLKRHRHRRHRVLRARSRVLHLRRRALRPEPVLGLLLPRLGRGRVELRARDELDGSPNLGYKIRYKEGYFPVPPMDQYQDLRSEMVLTLEQVGIAIEVQHHEVGTAGQAEIDMRFDTLLAMADKLMLYKYVVKNVARAQRARRVTFMPKPLFQDNGSGMHVHQSLWKGGEPLFFDEKGYAGLSDIARWYIGGLLKHAPSLLAFTNPTTNSYKRLVPGYEAPVNLVYSQRNRSAAVRIPLYSKSPKAKRLEFRCPDPSCNPYLAFSAMLMAGLDGIQNRIEPPDPLDKDLYDLPPEELAKVPQVPGSLDEVLDALEADHEFLLAGGVFTPDVIETWIEYKRENEIDAAAPPPAPVGVLPLLRHLIRSGWAPAIDKAHVTAGPLGPAVRAISASGISRKHVARTPASGVEQVMLPPAGPGSDRGHPSCESESRGDDLGRGVGVGGSGGVVGRTRGGCGRAVPKGDAFYVPPQPLAKAKPGTIIRSTPTRRRAGGGASVEDPLPLTRGRRPGHRRLGRGDRPRPARHRAADVWS